MNEINSIKVAVFNAANKLKAEGKTPSIRSVTAAIGCGSPNTVAPLLREWKTQEGLMPLQGPPAMTLRLQKLLFQYVEDATADASAVAVEKALELEADVDFLAEKGRAAEARSEQLQIELNQANDECKRLNVQLAERTTEIRDLKSTMAGDFADATVRSGQERDALAIVRVELVKAHLKLEAMPKMELKITKLSEQLSSALSEMSWEAKDAAVASAKMQAAVMRADESMAREKILIAKIVQLEAELVDAKDHERGQSLHLQRLARDLASAETRLAVIESCQSQISDQKFQKRQPLLESERTS